MTSKLILGRPIPRRTLLKAGAAIGATAVFSPPILTYAQGETPIKIGMHDPFTGTTAAPAAPQRRGPPGPPPGGPGARAAATGHLFERSRRDRR